MSTSTYPTIDTSGFAKRAESDRIAPSLYYDPARFEAGLERIFYKMRGHPALTLPVLVDGTPLKAGLQIVGPKGKDETVCAVAAHLHERDSCRPLLSGI